MRVPTRLERDVDIDLTDPAGNPVVVLPGDKDFTSEKLLAFEFGERWQAASDLSIDLATFYNRYRDLASLEFGTPFVSPDGGQTVIPVVNRNLTEGHSDGVETLVTYSLLRNWQLAASYSFLDLRLHALGADLNHGQLQQGATPRNQLSLRSSVDLPAGLQIDAQLRHEADLRTLPEIPAGTGIPGYTELNLRLAWHPGKGPELSVVGSNLLHDHHVEFGAPQSRSAIERSVYAKIVLWPFETQHIAVRERRPRSQLPRRMQAGATLPCRVCPMSNCPL